MDALAQGIGYFFIYVLMAIVVVFILLVLYFWIHEKNQEWHDKTVKKIREDLKHLPDEVLQQQYNELKASKPVSDSIRAKRYYKAEISAYGQEFATRHKWTPA